MSSLLAGFYSSPKAEKRLFWVACRYAVLGGLPLRVMDVLASEWVKWKTLNFRLPAVAQERLCLSSLMSLSTQAYKRVPKKIHGVTLR